MTRTQRQVHLLVWLILAPVLALVLLIALLTDPLSVEPAREGAADGSRVERPIGGEGSP